MTPGLTAVLPAADLDHSTTFYARLGFRVDADHGDYRLLSTALGATLHLRRDAGVDRLANPCGVYLYAADVEALGAAFVGETIEPGGAEAKPWGMTEFSLSDPDGALVRVGWPS